MKKLMMNLCAAICAGTITAVAIDATAGCKSVPTNDTMYTASYAIGVASGLVGNMMKIDDESRNAVCDILNIVAQCVPETNQTFEVAWMPIAEKHVAIMVADGRLDEQQGKMVLTAFSLAVQGIDYIFEVRYPKAKTYKELVIAAIDGFSDGFLLVFKPANDSLSAPRSVSYDVDAYNWLIEKNRTK